MADQETGQKPTPQATGQKPTPPAPTQPTLNQPQSPELNTQQQQPPQQEQSPPKENQTEQIQQPHLIQSQKKEKRDLHLPGKSFIVALVTIAITIAVGIGFAFFLSSVLRKEEPQTQPERTSPVVTTIPTQAPPQPTVKEETAPSSFESLLNPTDTSVPPSQSTTSANPQQ